MMCRESSSIGLGTSVASCDKCLSGCLVKRVERKAETGLAGLYCQDDDGKGSYSE